MAAYQLFETGTQNPTQRHRDLFSGKVPCTKFDILNLWDKAKESEGWTGVKVTLPDFVKWLNEGGEVTW